jgi:hypothetical protein
VVAFLRMANGKCINAEEWSGDDLFVETRLKKQRSGEELTSTSAAKVTSKDGGEEINSGEEFVFIQVDKADKRIDPYQTIYVGDPQGGLDVHFDIWDSDQGAMEFVQSVWKKVDQLAKSIPTVGEIIYACSEIARWIAGVIGDDDDKYAEIDWTVTGDELIEICDQMDFCFVDKFAPTNPDGTAKHLTENKDLWGGARRYEWNFKGEIVWGFAFEYTLRADVIALPAWGRMAEWKPAGN